MTQRSLLTRMAYALEVQVIYGEKNDNRLLMQQLVDEAKKAGVLFTDEDRDAYWREVKEQREIREARRS